MKTRIQELLDKIIIQIEVKLNGTIGLNVNDLNTLCNMLYSIMDLKNSIKNGDLD